MDFGSPEFVIAIVAISIFGWLASIWIRARHGYPLESDWSGMDMDMGMGSGATPDAKRQIELLSNENGALKGQISRLEERIAVLERIATDPAERTAKEIEGLR